MFLFSIFVFRGSWLLWLLAFVASGSWLLWLLAFVAFAVSGFCAAFGFRGFGGFRGFRGFRGFLAMRRKEGGKEGRQEGSKDEGF